MQLFPGTAAGLRYPSSWALIRGVAAGRGLARRVPVQSLHKADRPQAGHEIMLPGFRFLFATVVLAGAVLIFGLGAAALLRVAHEEFASLPSWHAAPPPLPARIAEPPTLALIRVEMPKDAPDTTAIAKDATPVILYDEQSAGPENTAVAPEVTAKPDEIADPPAASNTSVETPAPSIVEASPQPVAPEATAPVEGPSQTATVAPAPQVAAPEATSAPSVDTANPQPVADPQSATVASLPAPAKATAAAQPGKPAVTKARQAAAKAAARRRLGIARARAAARARALEQQKQKTLDPLTQLFGGA